MCSLRSRVSSEEKEEGRTPKRMLHDAPRRIGGLSLVLAGHHRRSSNSSSYSGSCVRTGNEKQKDSKSTLFAGSSFLAHVQLCFRVGNFDELELLIRRETADLANVLSEGRKRLDELSNSIDTAAEAFRTAIEAEAFMMIECFKRYFCCLCHSTVSTGWIDLRYHCECTSC